MAIIRDDDDRKFMHEALAEAKTGYSEGEVPIGAVAVRKGKILSRGHNQRRLLNDLTAHAEMMCLRKIGPYLDDLDLSDIAIYSTLEPCAMCAGAMVHYKIGRVVYGAKDLRLGASGSKLDLLRTNGIEVMSGILDNECREVLYRFFEHELGKPSKSWEDIELE